MLLQPVCPERRGPSWVPSRRSRWPSALGAHSAPCATAFFSDRAEEACSSGESRAIYTNGHPNERSEEKGGKQQPKLRAPPWVCFSMPATCHGARVGVQGLPSALFSAVPCPADRAGVRRWLADLCGAGVASRSRWDFRD